MSRIGVLVSGRGSNLQALLNAQAAGQLGGEIVVVISNHAGVPALERAAAAGVPTVVHERAAFPSRKAQHLAICETLLSYGVEIVVLAGFDRILHPEVVRQFAGRILNVHPSLLPAFAGGLHAQADALEYGVKVTGCTVHFVTEEVDAGPIILQAAVPVFDDDTVESLSARILAEEHRLLPEAVRLLAEGRLRIEGRRVRIVEKA
ncbi:MAG: phosphoribosylglycinamide formyltransferase [Chloroflexota bacterium]|nr:phosphoribosylglycinamide formyltransferase [Dehalococcoidia bacterium]MDW8254083.1 phosphoribosylglycinamide formyltransferase [Chloroflexota bacterium]